MIHVRGVISGVLGIICYAPARVISKYHFWLKTVCRGHTAVRMVLQIYAWSTGRQHKTHGLFY